MPRRSQENERMHRRCSFVGQRLKKRALANVDASLCSGRRQSFEPRVAKRQNSSDKDQRRLNDLEQDKVCFGREKGCHKLGTVGNCSCKRIDDHIWISSFLSSTF